MEQYSVLMSIYDKVNPEDLNLSIKSIVSQSYMPEQFVIVYDGPINDSLQSVIEGYEKQFQSMFTIVKNHNNMGLAYSLNVGLEASRNELVARMDSDDYSLPNRCKMQVIEFEKDNDLVLLGGNVKFFSGSINNILNKKRIYPSDCDSIRKALRRSDPFSHPAVMYKKSIVQRSGGYDPSLRRRQDYDLFSRMVITHGYKARNLQEYLLLFRAEDDYFLRNKSRESCINRIEVQRRIYRRKACSLVDFIIVWMGMTISMFLPNTIYKIIYKLIK